VFVSQFLLLITNYENYLANFLHLAFKSYSKIIISVPTKLIPDFKIPILKLLLKGLLSVKIKQEKFANKLNNTLTKIMHYFKQVTQENTPTVGYTESFNGHFTRYFDLPMRPQGLWRLIMC
jgi:hypothetical protein